MYFVTLLVFNSLFILSFLSGSTSDLQYGSALRFLNRSAVQNLGHIEPYSRFNVRDKNEKINTG